MKSFLKWGIIVGLIHFCLSLFFNTILFTSAKSVYVALSPALSFVEYIPSIIAFVILALFGISSENFYLHPFLVTSIQSIPWFILGGIVGILIHNVRTKQTNQY